MRYIKTYEQVQDFYKSGTTYYMIVSQDEKWYVKSNKNYSAAEMNEDNGYEIFPMSELSDIDINITYDFDNARVALKELNNLDSMESSVGFYDGDHIAVSFENYEKYGKDLNVEKRGVEELPYPSREDNLLDDDSISIEFEDGDPVSHKVIGMKFKSVEFVMGLHKNQKLNI